MAIEETVNYVLDNRLLKSLILSDSLSVLSNLQAPDCSGTINHNILRIKNSPLKCKNLGISVKLMWIPSHRGIPGNEMADSLAKESLHLPDPFLISKCHYSNLYSKFKMLAVNKARILCVLKASLRVLDTFLKSLIPFLN